MRLALAIHRHQQVAAVDVGLARALHVHRRPLQRAPEAGGLLRLALGAFRQRGQLLGSFMQAGGSARGSIHTDHRDAARLAAGLLRQ